ncbi:MAG: SLC13 family permease [Gammaproteobacteria bacterium]|nr:SLC13 family permease [Gammaproteobacteria bacterium]
MISQPFILFVLIGVILAFLIWGRLRYDVVAFAGLVAAVFLGVVPADRFFSGFGHPAVVIIALVLIASRGLYRSGAIELIARQLTDSARSLQTHIGVMAAIAAALSSVINNVAALTLLMTIDTDVARRAKRSPALTLMPLSFASILGGMVTLIGTPPNIVIATFRADALGEPYRMFDFAPVGAAVAVAGVLFVALIGWRLIPAARGKTDTGNELRDFGDYIAEAGVPAAAQIVGETVRELDSLAEESDVQVLGLVRRGKRLPGAARRETVLKGDSIVLEGSPTAIQHFIGAAGLEHIQSDKDTGIASPTLALMEVVVPVGARIARRSAQETRLLYRHGVKLLGISRRGKRIRERVRKARIEAGDILLLLGQEDHLPDVVEWLGCLPLAGRGLEVIERGKSWAAVSVFAAAIVGASFGLVNLPAALAAVVVVYVVLRIVPLSQLYESIEWPVIVLLGSMIPLGAALETSGGAALIAAAIVDWTGGLPNVAVLVMLMIVTMTLSDVLNNVATALIAAPIAVDIAQRLEVNPDTFLMGVAVAASCAFLTPIGHKNNTIIMGPGGYRFGDYWRMGLPLEILVMIVSVPMLLLVWPLTG